MKKKNPLFQKKSLGQVFLKNDKPIQRVIETLQDRGVQRVLEIGPGKGVLTFPLAKSGFALTAVEKDERFANYLDEHMRFTATMPKFDIVNQDALDFDFDSWISEDPNKKTAIVGNIPYNISSPLILKILEVVSKLDCSILLTQLEFAERLAAQPGSKVYGSISVYAQLRSHVQLLLKVPKEDFTPVPQVDSALSLMTPYDSGLSEKQAKKVEMITRAAFAQRRKKLRNSLRAFIKGEENFDFELRPERLSPQEFVDLTQVLVENFQQLDAKLN